MATNVQLTKNGSEVYPKTSADIVMYDDNNVETTLNNLVNSGKVLYGTCTTASGTKNKVATLTNSNFTLTTGSIVYIKMSYSNATLNATLNVNKTGAKTIMLSTDEMPEDSAGTSWSSGSIVPFIYDGSNWVIAGWLNTEYGIASHKLEQDGLMQSEDKYALDNYTWRLDNITSTAIGESKNLNNYIDIGNYYCGTSTIAKTLNNCPVSTAFNMKVFFVTGTSTFIAQLIIKLTTGQQFYRYYSSVENDNGEENGWSDWNSLDATYSAGSGLSLTDTKFSLDTSGVTSGTYGPSADVTGDNNSTIKIPRFKVDSYGRVTSATDYTLTCKDTTYNAPLELGYRTEIPDGSKLNNYTTPGCYASKLKENSFKNAPSGLTQMAFLLDVYDGRGYDNDSASVSGKSAYKYITQVLRPLEIDGVSYIRHIKRTNVTDGDTITYGDWIYQGPPVQVLWTNESPTSNFDSQNVDIGKALSNYQYIAIICKCRDEAETSTYNNIPAVILSTTDTSCTKIQYIDTTSTYIMVRGRNASISSNSVVFTNGTYTKITITPEISITYNTSKLSCIPYQIIGIG